MSCHGAAHGSVFKWDIAKMLLNQWILGVLHFQTEPYVLWSKMDCFPIGDCHQSIVKGCYVYIYMYICIYICIYITHTYCKISMMIQCT